MTGFPTREVREGRASILVPDVAQPKGPGRRTGLPFYNPSMAVSRDVTVAVLSAWLPRGAAVLDGLAATGVLGIRVGLEAAREAHVTWNDKNPAAHDLIVENAARNGLEGEVLREDLRLVLAKGRFAYVDIDPFGPPVPFVDASVQQSRRGSGLGIAATDVAPLAGTYPAACQRRYGARSMRNPCGHETALRIFLGYLVRVAAAHERGLRPIAAFAVEHFVKAIVEVDTGASAADRCLAQLGYVQFEGARFEISESEPQAPHAGPLWLGALAEPRILARMPAGKESGIAAGNLGACLQTEVEFPSFYYENHAMSQTLGVDPVPVAAWIGALRAAGFRACRTYLSPNGVRTNAPWDEVERLYRSRVADR